MRNIFAKSFFIAAAVVLAAGCIKEELPQGATKTSSQVAESDGALAAMANAIPVAMMATNTAGYYSTYGVHTDFGIGAIHLMTEFMLEDLATLGSNPYYNRFYSQAMNNAMGERYISCAYYWDCYYTWIKACNDIISIIDPETANDEAIKYLGQAYAYRAMCYLDLARLFEPKENKYTDVSGVLGLTVPIITEQTKEQDATFNPRADRETMYEFILGDLAKAETYLEGKAVTYTAPSSAAVWGLYARTYLEMGAAGDEGAYDKAASYARKVIDESGKTPLTQTEWEDPVNGFNKGSANNSWIWGLTLSADNAGNIMTYTAHICSEGTWGYAGLSHIGADKRFYDSIDDKDFRKHSWLDPRREGYYRYKYAGSADDAALFLNGSTALQIDPAMDYQSIKFRPANGETSDYVVGNLADHVLMRVEEMYFIEMEAVAHKNLASARGLLNDFMKNRITDGSYDCSGRSTNLANFLEEMLFQKRVEFWGEGVLMYDYKRLDKGITRGYPGTNHAGVYRLNCEGRSPQWNIVITRGEFQSNTGITSATNNPDPSGLLPLWTE